MPTEELKKPLPAGPKAGDLITLKFVTGTEEPLRLRELSNSELDRFTKLLVGEDSPGIIALCFKRNLAWVDSLTRDSYNEAINVLIKQNFSATMELAIHDTIVGLRVGPLMNQIAQALQSAISRNSALMLLFEPPPGTDSPNTPAGLGSPAPIGEGSIAIPPASSISSSS